MNESLRDRVNRQYYENTIIIYNIAILDVDLIDDMLHKLSSNYSSKLRFIRHFYRQYRNEYVFSDDSIRTINNKKYALLKKLETIPDYVKTTIENTSLGFIDAIISHLKSCNITYLDENEGLDTEDIKEYWEDARK
jgi:hypothetical protein